MLNKIIKLTFVSLIFISFNLIFYNQVSATWTEQTLAGSRNWRFISSSSDGTKLAAVVYPGGCGGNCSPYYPIYTSSDSGATWTEQTLAGSRAWTSITSSSDGTKLAAVVNGGYIYTSSDSGATWTEQTLAGLRSWASIASSSDGTKLAAVLYNGYIYTSSDSGATWTEQTLSGSRAWRYISSSSDGTKLAAVVSGGYIYTSSDSGATWTEQTLSGSRSWNSIASSFDGTKLAAVLLNGYIYTSSDSGATWTEQTLAGSRSWTSIASSSDGTKLAAVVQNGYIYTSSDSGATWTEQTLAGSRNWNSISSSSDGTKLAAVVNGGYVYQYTQSVPQLITSSVLLIDTNSVTLNANITNTGGEQATVRGFQYGLTTSYGTTTTENGSFGTGTFSATISSLTPNTTYHYRAYTTNSSGTGYSDDGVFTTKEYFWAQQTLAGSRNWNSIASSFDGTKLAAVVQNGYIYTSSDSGATWTQQTLDVSRAWYSIASSSDGTKLAAVVNGGYIYTSSDSGATWTQQTLAGSRSWNSIASSSDGTKLAAVVNGGYIYTSSDSGATWTQQTLAGSRAWNYIASSSDGTKLAAVVNGGYIYTSSDSGATWTQQTLAGSRAWYSIASSSDGTKLAAVVSPAGYIYTSSDSGATWTEQTLAGSRSWRSITSSSDGIKLAAVVNNGYIYTSSDSGATWTEQTLAGSRNWRFVASSSDGTKLAAVVNGEYVYIYSQTNILVLITNYTVPINFNTSKLYGHVNSHHTVRGFEYGLTTSYGATIAENGSFEYGVFSLNVSQIIPNIEYHYRSYAYGSDGVSYGNDNIFTLSTSSWTEQTLAGSRAWTSIASSSDGTKLAAVVYNGYIYTSSDSGATWTEQTLAGSRSWSSIASSSDGTKLAAVVQNGYIYTSSDSGATWTEQTLAGSRSWRSITSSSDGIKLAATIQSGCGGNCPPYYPIYTSSDSGATWTEQTLSGSRAWGSIASSSDGTKLAAVIQVGGYIYTSSDSGATWTQQTLAGSRSWRSITSSSDGIKLAAVVSGYIYTSSDSGTTWTEQTLAGSRNWYSIASSSDGTKLAAVVGGGGYIYTSSDSGATWTEQTLAGSRNWNSISSSSDGTKLAAVVNGGYIYTYPLPPASIAVPQLITSSVLLIDTNSVTLNANITNTGGEQATVRGFQYGLTTSYGTTTTENGSFGTGTFSATISSLTPNTTYHYRAYATNSSGTGYSDDGVFTTPNTPPTATVSISGSEYVGNTLTGSYTYEDAEDDEQGTSTYRWLRDNIAIDGQTSTTYTTTNDDLNKTIKFEVTPVALTGELTGTPALSSGLLIKRRSGGGGGGGGGGASTPTIPNTTPVTCQTGHIFSPETGKKCTIYTNNTTPTSSTEVTLPITRTLKQGMKGNDVKTLQIYLNTHNFASPLLIPDGSFGLKTKNAVISFQGYHKLTADGVVGPKTRGEMR